MFYPESNHSKINLLNASAIETRACQIFGQRDQDSLFSLLRSRATITPGAVALNYQEKAHFKLSMFGAPRDIESYRCEVATAHTNGIPLAEIINYTLENPTLATSVPVWSVRLYGMDNGTPVTVMCTHYSNDQVEYDYQWQGGTDMRGRIDSQQPLVVDEQTRLAKIFGIPVA